MTSIIITGNIVDGVGLIGPFEDSEMAIEYAELLFGNDLDWNVADLHEPDELTINKLVSLDDD